MFDVVDSRFDDPSYAQKPLPAAPDVAPVASDSNMAAIDAARSAAVRGGGMPAGGPLALNASERGPAAPLAPSSSASVEQAAAAGVLPPTPAAAPAPAAVAQPTQPAGPAMAQQTEVTTQIAPKLSQDRKDATQLAFERQQQAIESAARVEANKEEASAAVKEYRQNELAKQRMKDQADAEKIKVDSDKAQEDWLKAQDEWKKSSETKPPQETLGERIVNAIAIGLGAYASTMSGGPNQALQIVNNAREQRIRQWEREVEGAKGRAEMKGNLVAFYRNKGLDQRAAANAARLSLIDATDQQLDMITSGYKSPEIRARADAAKAANAAEREKYLNQNYLDEQNKQVRRTLTSPMSGPSAEAQRDKDARTVVIESQDKNGNVTQQEVLAPDPAEAKRVREMQDAAASIKSNLAAIQKISNEKWESLNPTARKEITTYYNEIIKDKGKMADLGALSGADLELSKPIGDPTSIFQTEAQTKDLIGKEQGRIAQMLQAAYKNRRLIK